MQWHEWAVGQKVNRPPPARALGLRTAVDAAITMAETNTAASQNGSSVSFGRRWEPRQERVVGESCQDMDKSAAPASIFRKLSKKLRLNLHA
jgi:hypothetical protein